MPGGRIDCITSEINRMAGTERFRAGDAYRYHRGVSPDGHSVRMVVIVLVRRGHRYLMVRDDMRGGTWYPPAGTLEHGEDLRAAANRVVQRASGCTPVLEGIVRISHMPLLPGSDLGRLRFVLEAHLSTEALFETTAKTPASYLLPSEVRSLELRDDSVASLIAEHARGMPTTSLELYRLGLA